MRGWIRDFSCSYFIEKRGKVEVKIKIKSILDKHYSIYTIINKISIIILYMAILKSDLFWIPGFPTDVSIRDAAAARFVTQELQKGEFSNSGFMSPACMQAWRAQERINEQLVG
jgi:hypothetical protein